MGQWESQASYADTMYDLCRFTRNRYSSYVRNRTVIVLLQTQTNDFVTTRRPTYYLCVAACLEWFKTKQSKKLQAWTTHKHCCVSSSAVNQYS